MHRWILLWRQSTSHNRYDQLNWVQLNNNKGKCFRYENNKANNQITIKNENISKIFSNESSYNNEDNHFSLREGLQCI